MHADDCLMHQANRKPLMFHWQKTHKRSDAQSCTAGAALCPNSELLKPLPTAHQVLGTFSITLGSKDSYQFQQSGNPKRVGFFCWFFFWRYEIQ